MLDLGYYHFKSKAERTAGGLTVSMPMSLEDTQETGGPEKE